MIWATSNPAHSAESSLARPLPPLEKAVFSEAVPLSLWRDDASWDGSSVIMVEPEGMRAVGTAAAVRGYLWVPIVAPRPAQRGRLALHIEECIEAALEQRGAPPPGIGASTDLDASLSDQLYRARFVEMRGIAVGIPSLEGIANLGRVLDAEDSAVLRWWLAATTERPISVVLSSENRSLRVYPSPVPFGALMERVEAPSPRPPSAEVAASVVAMELSELPPEVAADDDEADSLFSGENVDLPELDRALGFTSDDVSLASAEEPAQAGAPAAHEVRSEEAHSQPDVEALSAAAAPGEPVAAAAEPVAAAAEPVEQQASVAAHAVTEPVIAPEASEEVASAAEPELVVAVSADSDLDPIVSVSVDADEEDEAPKSELASAEAAPLEASVDESARLAAPLPVKSLVSPFAQRRALEEARPNASAPSVAAPSVAAPTESPTEERSAVALPAIVLEEEPDEVALNGDQETSKDAVPVELAPQSDASAAPSVSEEPSVESSYEAAPASEVSEPSGPEVVPLIAASALRAPLARKRTPFILPADDADEGEPLVGDVASQETPAARPETNELTERPSAAPALQQPRRSALRPLRPRPPAQAPAAPAEVREPADVQESDVSAGAPREEIRPPAPSEPDPFEAFARDNWRSWVQELEAARGPKPLAVIERLFVTCYMRLDAAVQRGIADASAREALVTWRDSFAKSYTEAFDALRVRGKRPTMVLDIPDLAQRMGRLHGARRVQLMLVDGLRFDLGMMVQDRLKSRGDATLTERLLLWSALPTNTTTQIELIGRGPDGLKDKDAPAESPAVVARGRAAHAARRIRTGRRELFKLDIVEASLREGEGGVRERLVTIADDVSAALTDHFTKQPPRTLVMVFGDHGFRIDDSTDRAVQVVSQGGATPEEVLVPAFAWLTGAPH